MLASEVELALTSMTGFGRGRGELSSRFTASVVIRSVNHKYLDVQVRTNLREETPELEAAVRAIVASGLQRGRVTVQVNLEKTAPSGTTTLVDGAALTKVLHQLRDIESEVESPHPLELRDVLSIPGLVTVAARETRLDQNEIAALEAVVRAAMAEFTAMKDDEATRLADQLEQELARLTAFLDELDPELEEIRGRIFERLRERIERLLGPEVGADPERVVQEAALLADRSEAVSYTHLRAHETYITIAAGGWGG